LQDLAGFGIYTLYKYKNGSLIKTNTINLNARFAELTSKIKKIKDKTGIDQKKTRPFSKKYKGI